MKIETEKLKLKKQALDTNLSIEDRKNAALKLKEKSLNPLAKKDFDPETFEPNAESELTKLIPRARKHPPKRLPTYGLKPKEIMEGQMIGMLESKQDLYLLIAWLSNRVADLEELVEKMRK